MYRFIPHNNQNNISPHNNIDFEIVEIEIIVPLITLAIKTEVVCQCLETTQSNK